MKLKDAFPGKYLSSANFSVPRTLTVQRVEIHDVSGAQEEPEKKPVVFFKEHPHGLVLNKTNFKTLTTLFGEDSDMWTDGQCEVYCTTTDFKGETVPCVRIRAVKTQAAPPRHQEAPQEERYEREEGPPVPDDEDDIPF